ncbi:MAG: class I SAM-dependent methyltransferase [Candidatus Bipolaricaulia bacterium]
MSEIVRDYYDACVNFEWGRLTDPYHRFELESTRRLIDEYFPSEGRIVDVGGGPGRYTVELLQRGHSVSLVDLSAEAIEFAKRKLAELGLEAELVACADARCLDCLNSAAFDAGLLLGPLYHLVDEEDRRKALSEFHRILKPGAPGIVGFINPWGILRSGLNEFPTFYANREDAAALLGTYHKIGEQAAFTESVFLPPPQALDELRAAGFAVEARAGVEGFASGMLDEVARIAEEDPEAYENILLLVAETCQHPAYRDCTEHLHVVVRRLDGRWDQPETRAETSS